MVGEGGAAQIPGRRLTHTSQAVETQTALCLQLGGCCQVSALRRAKEAGARSRCWAPQGACTQRPIGSISEEDGPGTPGQQMEGTHVAMGKPLRRDIMHLFKAIFQNSFISWEHGEIVVQMVSGPLTAPRHIHSWEGRGSGLVGMTQCWLYCRHFRTLCFFIFKALRGGCALFLNLTFAL